MNPKPYQIYFIPVRLNESRDQRPCIVIHEPANKTVAVLLISGQTDLYDRSQHFLLDIAHPDFSATGLSKSCYVLPRVVDVPSAQFLRFKGVLKGELLKDFLRWLE